MTHVRTLLSHSSKIFTALVATALVFTWTVNAQANTSKSQPADKVAATANIDDIRFVEEGESEEILKETFRTSVTSDLLLQIASECSIVTEVTTVGNDNAKAHGQLRYHLTISTDGGPERPIGVMQTSAHPTEPGQSTDDGGAVFCSRIYERETTLFNDEDATIRTFMETRDANAFNWVQLNAGRGIHTVRLYATYTETEFNTADAQGVVGRRTMIIEPVKMKVNEQVTDLVVD